MVFKKIGKEYIFQIVFEIINLNINYWMLGQAFFRKYNSFFTLGEKESMFSYYPIKKEKVAQNEETPNEISVQIILIIILSIILIFLLGLLIYFYFYCEKKKRKRKAQELNEDYDYTSVNDDKEAKKNMIVND